MAEVAGLVLGSIPLLISAVEHYQECFRILGCMREFRQEYRRCRRRVMTLEVQYDLTLDKLFLDVVDSQEELARLKACPNDRGWIEVGAKLKERLLPKVHQSYLGTMRDMQDAIQDLGEELGVGKSSFQEHMRDRERLVSSGRVQHSRLKPEWSAKISIMAKQSQGRASYEAQRLKFSQGKSRRDDLFDQIEGYNRSLDGLMSKNDDVTKMLRDSRRPTLIHRGLLEFWRHARNVYSLLSLSWTCPCRAEHCADLRLMYRETADVHFEIYFRSNSSSVKCSQNPWTSRRVVVDEGKRSKLSPVSSENHIPEAALKPGSQQQLNQDRKTMPLLSALKKSSEKSGIAPDGIASAPPICRAIQSGFASCPTSRGANASVTFKSPALVTEQTLKQSSVAIENLCQVIGTHISNQPCSGLLTAEGIDMEYSLLSPATDSKLPSNTETTTLATLLSESTATPNRMHRYSIALAVASSHLQLHSSLWLGHQWSGEKIFFDVINGSVAIDKPHLRAGFGQNGSVPQQASPIDETFVTLGILLLELCFGTTLENSPFRNLFRSPDGQQDSVMDLAAALKWAERVEGEAGPEYADAVDWCLGRRRVRQRDNAWRRDLLQTVIEPLKCSYQKLTSTGV